MASSKNQTEGGYLMFSKLCPDCFEKDKGRFRLLKVSFDSYSTATCSHTGFEIGRFCKNCRTLVIANKTIKTKILVEAS